MKKITGFSLIELIFVVIILGILAATALPRFIDVTDQAKDASLEGVAGGFATAVSLVRSQWETLNRPTENGENSVLYDGQRLYLTTPGSNTEISPGYPLSTEPTGGDPGTLSPIQCSQIWNVITHNPPRITNDFSEIQNRGDYFKYYATTTGSGLSSRCLYFQVSSLNRSEGGIYQDPGSNEAVARNFSYTPSSGQVMVITK